MENPSHNPIEDINVAPGNDEVHLGIYEQLAAEQAAASQEAERQAEIERANAAAVEAGRLTGNERRLYRGIAKAAGVDELPEGVSEEDLQAARVFNSNRVTAAANFATLKEQANARLEADKKYSNDQRAERRRVQQEERRAERTAERERKHDAMRDEANTDNTHFDLVAGEAARVHGEVKARAHAEKLASIDERVEAGLAKHSNMSKQSQGMMHSGLRDQLTRQAEPEAIAEADKAAQERKEYINANGGAEAIEAIRAREEEEARAAADEEKRQAFLDRLNNHSNKGNRDAIVAANRQRGESAGNAEQQAPSSYLSTSDRAQLATIIAARNSSELPGDMDADARLSTVGVRVGRAQAAENLNRIRASAQERLNNDEDARRALIERAQENGIGDFTDEEIAALPATVNEFMSDDDVTAYLQRMHQIRGAEPRTDGRDERDPRGYQSFSGPRGEFADDLAQQRSLFPGEALVPGVAAPENAAPDIDFDLDNSTWDTDPTTGQPAVGEAQARIDPADLSSQPLVSRLRRPLRPVRPVPDVSFGGDTSGAVRIPDAPVSGRAPQRGEQIAELPLTPREQRAAERAEMSLPARAWDTVKRWWPGRSRTSWENDRPRAITGVGRLTAAGTRATVDAASRALASRESTPEVRELDAYQRAQTPRRPVRRPAQARRPDDNNVGVDILNGL